MVEPLSKVHIDTIAALHYVSLTGLLRDLGPGAIRAFYAGAIESEFTIASVFSDREVVQGFVFGSTNPAQLKRHALKNNFFQIMIGICFGVVRRPSTLVSLWQSTRDNSERSYDTELSELTYLAVGEGYRMAGVARQLVQGFGQALLERGVSVYELSVDADNTQAIDFYHRMGFLQVGEYWEYDVKHVRFRLELT